MKMIIKTKSSKNI